MIPDPGTASPAQEPMALYQDLRQKGLLQPDPAQQLAVERLQSLYRALLHCRLETGLRGWLARFGLTENGGAQFPLGLYLCGPVSPGWSKPVYHHALDPAAHGALAAAFAELTDGAPGASATLLVKERSLVVPRAARGVAWFGFTELCRRPLAAADYLAITEHFAAVIVEGIPRLGPAERDAARRFNILIDTLYEARTLLVASAEAPPHAIYTVGDGTFEFRRTISRLIEMQSADYITNRPRR